MPQLRRPARESAPTGGRASAGRPAAAPAGAGAAGRPPEPRPRPTRRRARPRLGRACATGSQQREFLRLRGRFRGRRGLVAFLAVMGPGLIAGIAGNDAGGITTYCVLGAETGFRLLWLFPITIVILAVVQEMAARLGVVTGQGLSRPHPRPVRGPLDGLRDARPAVANLANTVAEFAGAAAALEIFGISR